MKKKNYITPLTRIIQTNHEAIMQQGSWYDGENKHPIIEGNPDDNEEDRYAKANKSFNVWDQ